MAAPKRPSRHAAKLSRQQVAQIRSAGYYRTSRQIADELGVHYRTIEKIRSMETWAEV